MFDNEWNVGKKLLFFPILLIHTVKCSRINDYSVVVVCYFPQVLCYCTHIYLYTNNSALLLLLPSKQNAPLFYIAVWRLTFGRYYVILFLLLDPLFKHLLQCYCCIFSVFFILYILLLYCFIAHRCCCHHHHQQQ